jgi:hypothetical protein
MKNWAPLWSGLVDSSIWEEPDDVFRVFMAMLSLKDVNHVVSMDGYKLARRIHMEPVERVEAALKTLSEPDPRRKGQEFDGRRIKKVDDGWEILNGEVYRKMVQEEMRRVRNRKAQAAWRERKKVKSVPQAGERVFVKDVEDHGVEVAEARMDRVQEGNGSDMGNPASLSPSSQAALKRYQEDRALVASNQTPPRSL